jgi:hypothetical protein
VPEIAKQATRNLYRAMPLWTGDSGLDSWW